MKTPLYIITGFLGAGKTTFVKSLIHRDLGEVSLLINDAGEVNVDSQLLGELGAHVHELTNGCLCCELEGELRSLVEDVLLEDKPKAIVLETSGEADPLALLYQLDHLDLFIDGVVCLVDCSLYSELQREELAVFNSQISHADVVLLNRWEELDPDQIKALEAEVRSKNPHAVVLMYDEGMELFNVFPALYGKQLERVYAHRTEARLGHSHLEKDGLVTLTFHFENVLDHKRICEVLEQLRVYRIKGVVNTKGGKRLVQGVLNRVVIENTKLPPFGLVFIGRDLDKEEIEGAIDGLKV